MKGWSTANIQKYLFVLSFKYHLRLLFSLETTQMVGYVNFVFIQSLNIDVFFLLFKLQYLTLLITFSRKINLKIQEC